MGQAAKVMLMKYTSSFLWKFLDEETYEWVIVVACGMNGTQVLLFFMTDSTNAQLFLRVRKPLNTAGAFQISHIKIYLIEIFLSNC